MAWSWTFTALALSPRIVSVPLVLLARGPRSGLTRPGIRRVRLWRSVTPALAISASPTAEMLYGISDTDTLLRVAVTIISSTSAAVTLGAYIWATDASTAETAAEMRE